jgi:hypothetical protein
MNKGLIIAVAALVLLAFWSAAEGLKTDLVSLTTSSVAVAEVGALSEIQDRYATIIELGE